MFGLLDQLRQVAEPIQVGIAGIGSVGTGLILQASRTPGIRCAAVADLQVDRAVTAARRFDLPHRVVDTPAALDDVVSRGDVLAVCEDARLLSRCAQLDVLIESTSAIHGGAVHALDAIEHGTHVVMMNYEADLMFGPLLMHLAEQKDVVYTVCDGDQPAVLKRLIDEVRLMDFRLVMAGNVKGYLDRYVDPTTIAPEADKRFLDHRMCASYTDGSKLGVEMAVVANGLGLEVDVPGMHGPRAATVMDVFDLFDLERIWDGRTALVDYILGAEPRGSVFVIGHTDHEYQQQTLGWLPPKIGPGPFYVFSRPYHLVHFEAMASVAEAALNRRAILRPEHGFRTNVYCYAKRPLAAGDVLDGIGGYHCYGLIENNGPDGESDGIPICLAEDMRVVRDIPRDERLTMSDVEFDRDRDDFRLFRRALEAGRVLQP